MFIFHHSYFSLERIDERRLHPLGKGYKVHIELHHRFVLSCKPKDVELAKDLLIYPLEGWHNGFIIFISPELCWNVSFTHKFH
jgi:hypothetical protein